MTDTLWTILFISIGITLPVAFGVISYLLKRGRSERESQLYFEAKLKDLLTERNRHLSKLVESLLFESIDIVREDLSEADYAESKDQAARIIDETNKAIRILEEDKAPSSIASLTILQGKLQEMVNNLDSEIVARQEHVEIDYKSLN
jgi:cell division protein FtsX